MSDIGGGDTCIIEESANTPDALEELTGIYRRLSKVDVVEWALPRLSLSGHETVLDAGCGAGNFLLRARSILLGDVVVGLDIAHDLLQRVRASGATGVSLVRGDVTRLPLASESFDVTMANFMLQLVPDIGLALRELFRVLRPSGKLACVTSSSRSKREFHDLHFSLLREVAPEVAPEEWVMARFDLEEGRRRMEEVFGNVKSWEYEDLLLLPDVPTAMRFYRLTTFDRGTNEVSMDRREELWLRMQQTLERHFAAHDSFTIRIHNGMLLSTRCS